MLASTDTPLRSTDPDPEEIAERELWRDAALRAGEYAHACAQLGRRPTWTETSIIGVMWSEHCSYRSSKHLLRTLPTDAPHVIQGPGENAGVVDLGDGWAAAFKVESHNHPSAVEPFHGAATGVGGIVRDVFTMGARPVAILDSLRFGRIDADGAAAVASRHLVDGVVRGIAHYGNCVGIPTVGGETVFDDAYAANPLVNAMCVGVLRYDELQLGSASGIGNTVLYVGARTGRDGIHGATFASVDDPHAQERSAVQIGDPFREKLLIEACLELFATDIVVGVQDMGAAGLTSSAVEMAARAGSGIEMDLDRVPCREDGMAPWELMLSESQERMLVVVRAGSEQIAREIFTRWGLDCVDVGAVTDSGRLVLRAGDEVVCELPLDLLVDEAPELRWPVERDPEHVARDAFDPASIEDVAPADVTAALHAVLALPNVASTAWIHDQFDSMVGAATVERPGSDAAVVALRGTSRALAMSIDCSGRWCELDPRLGAAHAVAEAVRNVACAGARPLAVTDCLNFSSPEVPHVAWQLEQCITGLGDACTALGTPVVSGNVSLYNRSGGVDIHPTPVVGALGVIDHPDHVTSSSWRRDALAVVLLGSRVSSIDGSEYLANVRHRPSSAPPPLDLELEHRLHAALHDAAVRELLHSAHDCGLGGLLTTLVECALPSGIGVSVQLRADDFDASRLDELLFGEGASRVVVAVDPDRLGELDELAAQHDVPFLELGRTGAAELRVDVDDAAVVREPVATLRAVWSGVLPALLDPAGVHA